MKKKLLVVAGSLVASVLLGFAVFWLLPSHPVGMEASLNRVERGMTREQVEEILDDGVSISYTKGSGGSLRVWAGDRGVATVHFDSNELVSDKAWIVTETIPEKIRRFLRLPWW